MRFGLNRIDLLYIAVLILSSYFMLTALPDIPLDSYARIAALGKSVTATEVTTLPVLLGIAVATGMFLVSRIVFKQTRFAAFFAALLLITSKAFINNFMSGGVSDIMMAVLGSPVIPGFALSKLAQDLALLPFAAFSMYFLLRKNRMKELATGLAAVLVSFFAPMVGAPILMILAADGLQRIGGRKNEDVIMGSVIAAAATLFIVPVSMQTAALAALVGLVTAAVLFTFESRHKVAYALCALLLFLSFEAGLIQALSTQRMDRETISAVDQLKGLDGRIAVASYYKSNFSAVALVRNGQQVLVPEAFRFLFTTEKPQFDYLLLDTITLDDPRAYAAVGNATARFKTFAFIQRVQQSDQTLAIFTTVDSNQLIMAIDQQGNIVGNRVSIDGVDESFYRLVELNATDPRFTRYILPQDDSDKNVFKVLLPDKFGQLNGTVMTQVWQSNSSRMRLYKFS
ncbi:Uncharacterised protein [uncultured archaeon]|nr:Uncharacterised protein [uncultured archaeon]